MPHCLSKPRLLFAITQSLERQNFPFAATVRGLPSSENWNPGKLWGINSKREQPSDASNVSSKRNTTAEGGGKWSSLPVLLLWMIKDKLDFFDDARVTAVCRDWWSASARYPKKKSIGDGMPWVMQVQLSSDDSTTRIGNAMEFISVTRKIKFSIDLPVFRDAEVLFSKQGWILMLRDISSLFLINPFTKATIKLPYVTNPRNRYYASFSTDKGGYPDCVVLLTIGGSRRQVTLRTAYIGDQVWIERSYAGQRTEHAGFNGLIKVGEHVYVFDAKGMMITFNMATRVWKELPGQTSQLSVSYIMEHEGHIVKLLRSGFNPFSYSFFRYDKVDNSWIRLTNDDVKETSWFVRCLPTRCCPGKKNGLKAFILSKKSKCIGTYDYFEVLVDDLTNGSSQILHLPYQLHHSATWVDIG